MGQDQDTDKAPVVPRESSVEYHRWCTVSATTERCRVPGGYLYKVTSPGGFSMALAYVPEPSMVPTMPAFMGPSKD